MTETEHLLVCLMEEASEVAKECAKALRFGLDDVNPNNPGGGTNRDRIVRELADLYAIVQMLRFRSVLRFAPESSSAVGEKLDKVRRMMEYARERGTLDAKAGA